MTSILLTGAGGSGAANFLDAIRRSSRPYRVVGVDSSPVRLHLSEADVRVLIPRAEDPSYGRALSTSIQRWHVDVVHPQTDPDVRAIGALRDQLGANTYLPAQETLETAADKLASANILQHQGVPVPEHSSFTSLGDVAPATNKVVSSTGRAWIRARAGAGSKAALPVRSGAQAECWVRWWMDERGMAPTDFMVSEFLPGREFAYQSVWQEGDLIAGQSRERLEYLYGHITPSGQTSTPAVARTVRIPAVDDIASRAIRALDPRPRGVYCVDLKEDTLGTPAVTEINAGRFFTTSNFFAAAGLNMPELLIRCAAGEQLKPVGTSPLEPDLYWIRMVDMGYRLVPSHELDQWPRSD